MSNLVYTFDSPDDARTYMREVITLWVAWAVGLAGLLATNAGILAAWAVVTLVTLFLLARPIQRRAEQVVPVSQPEGGVVNTALRGGTTRDRALRELLYGTGPQRVALKMAGMSQRWVGLRHLVVALTFLGMAYVVFGPRP